MIFDADKLVDTLDPPVFKVEGKEYVGRIFSAMEMARYQPYFDQMKEGMSNAAMQFFTKKFVREMFGRRACRAFLKLPAPVQLKLLTSFTTALGAAMRSLAPGQDSPDVEESLRLVSQSVSSSPGSSPAMDGTPSGTGTGAPKTV